MAHGALLIARSHPARRTRPVGDQARSAVAGTDDEDHVQVALADEAVAVDIEKIQARGGAPVAEQAWLDIVKRQGALEQGIIFEVNLVNGKIVGGAPVGVHFSQYFRTQGAIACWKIAHIAPRKLDSPAFQSLAATG